MSTRARAAGGVVVVGSANLDLFASVPAIPTPGETVLAGGGQRRAGGKGLNQAIAAARAGAPTTFVAAVGSDDGARLLLAEARASGVDTALVREVGGPSGTAWIMVQPDGENAIVVDSAANATLTGLTDAERAAVAGAAVVVAQLETPLPAVQQAAEAAHAGGARFVLNAAPARELPADLLRLVGVLVVNQHEARHLAGCADPADAGRVLAALAGAVVVTLGGAGAVLVEAGDAAGDPAPAVRRVPGVRAQVVDTTGAGDTFTGVLAATLAAGGDLESAVRRAVVAGALAVEAPGAVPSIPTADQIAARARQEGHP